MPLAHPVGAHRVSGRGFRDRFSHIDLQRAIQEVRQTERLAADRPHVRWALFPKRVFALAK